LICEQSPFFKAACNERWESGRSGTITLEDDDPKLFSIFLTWILTGDIGNAAECLAMEWETRKDGHYAFMQLAKCYVLGDVLQSSTFCNYIIDVIVSQSERYSVQFGYMMGTAPSEIEYIWTSTASTSPLCCVILDTMAADGAPDDDPTAALSVLRCSGWAEFYYDLCQRLFKAFRNEEELEPAWKKESCIYHTHPDQVEGYTCAPKPKVNSRSKKIFKLATNTVT